MILRGPGVYGRVIENIRLLKKQNRGLYVGIQFTVRPKNVSDCMHFAGEMAALSVDWILLNPFWFITEEESLAYEGFVRDNYGITPSKHLGFRMPYGINREIFTEQYQKIRNAHFPMQVSGDLKNPPIFTATWMTRPGWLQGVDAGNSGSGPK